MAAQLRAFFAAVMFLTRVPCPTRFGYDPLDLARSTVYFPVIGLMIGAIGAAVYAGASLGLSALTAGVLSVGATVWITGAFHEDALADACDGFGGGWERDQVLAIMKDSRIGSYGATGLALVLLARVGTIATFTPAAAARALVAAHVLARWSSLPLIRGYAYVRETDSKSKPFAASVSTARLAVGSVLALAIVVAVLGRDSVRALMAAALVTALGGRYFRRRIGGITGDCLGAANQLVELATYLALAWHS